MADSGEATTSTAGNSRGRGGKRRVPRRKPNNQAGEVKDGEEPKKANPRGNRRGRGGQGNPQGFSFNPNAPAFVPGPSTSNENPVPRANQNPNPHQRGRGGRGRGRGRGGRVPNLPQGSNMRETLIYQLENNKYDCPICFHKIITKQGLWSCQVCYQMFHISTGCIIDWARSSRDKEDDNKWRCPTCQNKTEVMPFNYYCFCGKQRNPTYQLGETPHSCGDVCGGARKFGCPHPCAEYCHPGPHPECQQQMEKLCNCGKLAKTVMCGSGNPIMCEDVCGKVLSCGTHTCTKICHAGECEECTLVVEQECFCGESLREVICNPDSHEKYNCGKKCQGFYDCKNHKCERNCHDISKNGCGECPQSISRIKNCPCGKKSLKSNERTSCLDAIPTCGSICDKLLECGNYGKPHRCRELCHEGKCPPCKLNTAVICRCKAMKTQMTCEEYLEVLRNGGEYLCTKRCKKRKSCLIHKCQENCCTQEEHICMQICNKRLGCGTHSCDLICHAGQCAPCLRADFEDKYCHCGKTVQMAPVACGAKPPECLEVCAREQVCEHSVKHKCHPYTNCPPCTELTTKWCYGQHEQRKTIACHIQSFSCGVICGKPLACGNHVCMRRCHGDECEKPSEKCIKKCEILRNGCEHICGLPCHGKTDCPPSACQTMVKVTCECGRIKNEMNCWNVDKIMNKEKESAEKTEENEKKENIEEKKSNLKRSDSMTQLNCIKCDEECKKLERNRKVAEALAIEVDEQGETNLTPIITFPCYLKDMVRTHLDFVKTVEKVFDGMFEQLSDATNPHNNVCSHTPPLSVEKRRFIHEYAHYFNIQSESVDQPPKRSVVLTATRGKSHQPLVYISELVNYKGALKTPGNTVIRKELMDEVRRELNSGNNGGDEKGMTTLKTTERMVYKRESRPIKQIAPSVPVSQKNMFSLLGSDDEDENDEQKPTSSKNVAPEKDWWNEETEKEKEMSEKEEDGWKRVEPKEYVVEIEKEVEITPDSLDLPAENPEDSTQKPEEEGTWEDLELGKMQCDDVTWNILHKGQCSFKAWSKPKMFCRNEWNLTGMCNRASCPLSNSQYATVREENGVCYLYAKVIERSHYPRRLWEKTKLSKDMNKALEQISDQLLHWSEFVRHKCKARLVRIHQYLIRMRKMAVRGNQKKLIPIGRKVERREKRREEKALVAAKLDHAIEKELLARLKQGTYGDVYNFRQEAFEQMLDNTEQEKELEIEEETERDDEDVGKTQYVADFDDSEDEAEDIEDGHFTPPDTDSENEEEWQQEQEESSDEGEDSDEEMEEEPPKKKAKKVVKKKKVEPKKPVKKLKKKRAHVEIEYEEETEPRQRVKA
ncbi:unnamed protein product [Caenorhabditis angaria]|uniref:R3H domain-containing protein n=1 Tax=Caenorhabditis angaria TaxID=860376 RepID=A0A9P1IHY6_9PELO|nr:unnamed protein product [Caenorhabditis angaria]